MVKPTATEIAQLLSAEEILSDKGYTLSTVEKQQEFDKQRNYHWTNTLNPIDFPRNPTMLRDRKLLVEQEITRLTDTAAQTYFDAILGKIELTTEYDKLRERITDLQHEWRMIQLLLEQGHE